MNTFKPDINKHYICSFESLMNFGEQFLLTLELMAFSFLSLVPGQALAFSQPFDVSNSTITFVIPYGLTRAAVLGEKVQPPSSLTLKPGMQISVWASAYSSTVGQTDADPFTTASGSRVDKETVASNFLPLGTVITLNGRTMTIKDRMNVSYNDKYMIDLWQPTQAEAFGWGLRLVTIQIVSLPH